MRIISCLILAAASAVSAQTPTPRPTAPRPPVNTAPRARPQGLPREWTSLPVEPWTMLTPLAVEPWTMLTPLPSQEWVTPFDFQFSLPTFEHEWQNQFPLEGLYETPLALEHGLMDLAAPLAPNPPAFPGQTWNDDTGPRGALSRMRPDQGTPEDSLYRAAREALNRGEYSRASTMFRSLEQKYPRSRVAPAVLYWQAFALYRAGASDDLRRALEVLKTQQERFPDAAADGEAATLRTRLQAALAARGDAGAAEALRQATAGGPTCDKEDVEVRAEALNALAQINPPEARPTLKKVLARRDECSVRLRRSAVYILGRIGTEESIADLIETAKTDPDPSVRNDAILLIGRSGGTATVKTLEQLFAETTDDRTRQAVLSALRSRGGPDARRVLRSIIERNDVPEKMRTEAISQLAGGSSDMRRSLLEAAAASGQNAATRRTDGGGDEEDAAYLRGLYGKTDAPTVKAAIIAAVARIGGAPNDQWILGIARNREEDMRLRREALSRLRSTSLSVDELGKLFDSLSERELRSAVVRQLAARDDAAAVDKLIEIAKSGTDPQIRREAISLLARKKDPRTTKLLLELVEKP